MSHFHSNVLLGASGNQGYEIERSLRFNSGDSTYLNWTPGSAGDRTLWTWSAWIKRSGFGSTVGLFGSYTASNNTDYLEILFASGNNLLIQGNSTVFLKTSQLFRDVSAWYHIVIAVDTSNSTADDRIKLWVNGEQVTAFDTRNNPSSGGNLGVNQAGLHRLGRRPNGTDYFNGYLAEVNFIDGTALDPTSFGKTDTATGAWIPKKYGGSYGTNGFYLDFSDNSSVSALGTDSSPNSNDWTPNNFSVTAGTGNDSMEDTPTNNWCTLNPLNRGVDNPTVSNGNLYLSSSSTDHTVVATFGIPSSGKWYWEYSKTANANLMSGIIHSPEDGVLSSYLGGYSNGYSVYASNGNKYNAASGSTYMATPATSTTITIAFDADTNKLYFGADGNWADGSGNTDQTFANASAAYTVATGYTYFPAISFNGGNAFANFGQRPFDHTPPDGYQALNTANLTVPTVKDGTEYFNTVLYTGTGSSNSITGVGFQPDWVWIKKRSASENHELQDAVRGATKRLASNSDAAETTVAGSISSFDSDGFTVVDAGTTNENTSTYVAWNWKANGSGSANTDGTISSTVSVNADAGFSIVEYTGNATQGATVGHGLGVAPRFIITKKQDAVDDWFTYHESAGNTKFLKLNSSNAATTSSGGIAWANTSPTSTVFSLGSSNATNKNGEDFIAYCFAEVEGYSKFGSYEGNNSSNGPFVYLGFRPAMVWVKSADGSEPWVMMDDERPGYNPNSKGIYSNTNAAENDASGRYKDFLSNGFKVRGTSGEQNDSGETYLYMAFAETPFKYANAR